MTAAARLAALDSLPADELCQLAESALTALVNVMNQETTLLRAGLAQMTGAEQGGFLVHHIDQRGER